MLRGDGRRKVSSAAVGQTLPPDFLSVVPSRAVRVLVVDDEVAYREALDASLTREGFEVRLAVDGAEALHQFAAFRPDLVLLDLMLPGMPGTEVCKEIHKVADVPVIMLSARDAELDIVLGLELGAADYVTKPYRLRELLARIQAVLRRSSTDRSDKVIERVAPTSEVVAGRVAVDTSRREVRVGGRPVQLSRREFDLLVLLLTPAGQVRTKEEIINRLWAGSELANWRTIDTHIRRLRLKLERSAANPEYLVTVRGVGFRFDPEGRPSRARS